MPLAAGVPWYWRRLASQVPPIHDISTDTADPPAFVAVLPLRADAPNPAAYGGPELAAEQASGYPDIQLARAAGHPPGTAFARARDAAREAGWAIVAADSAAGRVEATATTGWFGFKDDVVVRIRPEGRGAGWTCRSVSRVGKRRGDQRPAHPGLPRSIAACRGDGRCAPMSSTACSPSSAPPSG